jgi:hypothetical protein
MSSRHDDASAGDANYGLIGEGYARYRRPDPHIAATIGRALGGARTVLNVGAGAGSYEPVDRHVTAVEPSASMRAQRPSYLPLAIDAVAEQLPFEKNSFDASMATFTVHQWPDHARRVESAEEDGAPIRQQLGKKYPLVGIGACAPSALPVGEAALVLNSPPLEAVHGGDSSVLVAPQPACVEQRRQPRHAQI